MFCSKCGAVAAADAAFCQSCGAPISRTYPAGSPGMAVSPHSGAGAIAYASNVTYAGFWLRFLAYLIDSLVLGAALMVLLVPFFFLFGGVAILESLPRHRFERFAPGEFVGFIWLIFMLVSVSVLVKWLYYAYLESGERQATWGKQALGVYVTDLAGNRVTFGRASGRFFGKIVTGLVPLGLGYIMAGFTERRQALHDMIASCLVLRR